jgi:hypothetical protein
MKWLGTHILWLLGLIQLLLACFSGATDLFSPRVLQFIVFFGGLITALIGYVKTNPPDTLPPPSVKAHWCVTVLALLIALPMLGCQSLGLTTPQTFDQKLAYGYAGVTTALNTVTTALSAGQLSSAQATQANSLVLQAKVILDTARSEEGTNLSSAQNDLTLALTAMNAVETYLTQAGVKQ